MSLLFLSLLIVSQYILSLLLIKNISQLKIINERNISYIKFYKKNKYYCKLLFYKKASF